MIRAAGQDLEASRQELRDAEAAARAEAARLEADWRSAGSQVTRYAQAIVPQSSLALDAARSSYLAGRGDFSTVIEDFDAVARGPDRTGPARSRALHDVGRAAGRPRLERRRETTGGRDDDPARTNDPATDAVARPRSRSGSWRSGRSRSGSPLAGCGRSAGSGKAASRQQQQYHCPMHPTYVADRPGDCPICGMKLVPIEPKRTAADELGRRRRPRPGPRDRAGSSTTGTRWTRRSRRPCP